MKMLDTGHMMGEAEVAPSKPKKNEKYYPSLYLDDVKGLSMDGVPKTGTATIQYRLKEIGEIERDGKTTGRVTLEIQGIAFGGAKEIVEDRSAKKAPKPSKDADEGMMGGMMGESAGDAMDKRFGKKVKAQKG